MKINLLILITAYAVSWLPSARVGRAQQLFTHVLKGHTTMTQLNFAEAAAEALAPKGAAASTTTPTNALPKAKIWLNVGMNIPVPQADGTTAMQFVSIPLGIPFDTMEPMTARGNNPENNQKVEVGNMILAHFQKQVEGLAPSETLDAPELVVQFRRVQEQGVAGTGDENPLAASFIKLVG